MNSFKSIKFPCRYKIIYDLERGGGGGVREGDYIYLKNKEVISEGMHRHEVRCVSIYALLRYPKFRGDWRLVLSLQRELNVLYWMFCLNLISTYNTKIR